MKNKKKIQSENETDGRKYNLVYQKNQKNSKKLLLKLLHKYKIFKITTKILVFWFQKHNFKTLEKLNEFINNKLISSVNNYIYFKYFIKFFNTLNLQQLQFSKILKIIFNIYINKIIFEIIIY